MVDLVLCTAIGDRVYWGSATNRYAVFGSGNLTDKCETEPLGMVQYISCVYGKRERTLESKGRRQA